MHILLVDDSSSTRSLLKTLIKSGQAVSHVISEAASGEEALQKMGSGEIGVPDLVIVDINMGGMSGYDFCREFRQRYGTSSDVVPYVVVVTANEGIDVINDALDAGANDYMPKPVNVKVLQVRLRVAERLLSQAQTGSPASTVASVFRPAPADAQGEPLSPWVLPHGPLDTREAQIGFAIENADAPIALLDTSGDQPSFQIVYANEAMTSTTEFTYEQLMGKSLADLEAWTPEFLKMVLNYIQRGAILSYVPLWSRTRQAAPVHLSFYPVRSEDQAEKNYMVIHHF